MILNIVIKLDSRIKLNKLGNKIKILAIYISESLSVSMIPYFSSFLESGSHSSKNQRSIIAISQNN